MMQKRNSNDKNKNLDQAGGGGIQGPRGTESIKDDCPASAGGKADAGCLKDLEDEAVLV